MVRRVTTLLWALACLQLLLAPVAADFADHVVSFGEPVEDEQYAAANGLPVYPRQIAFDLEGNILLSGGFLNEYPEPGEIGMYVWLHRYTPTGALEEILDSATDSYALDWYFALAPDGTIVRSQYPIAIDRDGNRYTFVHEFPVCYIAKTSSSGATIAQWEPRDGATGIFVGLDGCLYVNRLTALGDPAYQYTVDRCDLDGAVLGQFTWYGCGSAFATDPIGRAYIINSSDCLSDEVRIQQYAPDGALLQQIDRVDGEPFPAARSLVSLALNADGDLAVVEIGRGVSHIFRYRRSEFSDIDLWFWAHDAVLACTDAGIVAGYPDGFYRPGRAVTRDQMAVFISRGLAGSDSSIPTGPAEATFPDVAADHWAYDYVEYAAVNNIVEGYGDGTYQPDRAVTRGQMAVFVARAMVTPPGEAGLEPYVPPTEASFPDIPVGFWCFEHVEYLHERSVVGGYPDGTYRPTATVTRDQMAVYIQRAFQLPL